MRIFFMIDLPATLFRGEPNSRILRGARCTCGGRELGKKDLAKRPHSLFNKRFESISFDRGS